MPTPDVVFNPQAFASMRRGFSKLARLLATTLGPGAGVVLSAGRPAESPEPLVDTAAIAQRFVELPDRRENVGAMLARHLAWRMNVNVGDGCATMATIAEALLDRAQRALAAGIHPAALQAGIAAATAAAVAELRHMTRPLAGEDELVAVARTVTGEHQLSALVAEIFDILGPDAAVTVEEYVAPYLEREYLHGGRWLAFLASPFLITSPEQRLATVDDAAVALFAGEVRTLDDVRPLLDSLPEDGRRLLLVANRVEGDALAALVHNQQRGALRVVAATMRQAGEANRDDYADLAALTGARVLLPEAGETLRSIRPPDLGRARRASCAATTLDVTGGRETPELREHLAALRRRAASIEVDRDGTRSALRARVGRLLGGSAVLKLGAATKAETALLCQRAERATQALATALRAGVVPGGGAAYLACLPAVRALALPGDQAQGAGCVLHALQAPLRQIVANAGFRDPQTALAEALRAGKGYGYDALADAVVAMEPCGVIDPAEVAVAALQVAASGAATLLSTDVLILKRAPAISAQP